MPDSSSATKSWFPGPIRFSLAGLLVFMTGMGIFFGVRNLAGVRWDDPLKAAATFLFLAGIATQVRDLERARRAAGPSSNARLRWEQAWRILAGFALVFCLVEIIVQHTHFEWFRWLDAGLFFQQYPVIGWYLLIFLLLQIPREPKDRYRSWTGRCLGIAGLLIGCLLLVIRCFDQMMVAALIYVAIRGVEVAQPYRRGEVVIYDFQFFAAEREWLLLGAYLAAGGWLLALLCGWLSLHAKSRSWQLALRLTAIVLLLALIPLTIWGRWLMISVQPFYLPHPDLSRPYIWGNGLALLCLLTVLTTAAVLRDSPRPVTTEAIRWRGPFGSYWHEQWLALLVLSFATLKSVISFVKEAFDPDTYTEFGFAFWWGMIFYDADLMFGMFILTWIVAGFWQCFRTAECQSFSPLSPQLRWPAAVGTVAFVAVLYGVGLQISCWLSWVLITAPDWAP